MRVPRRLSRFPWIFHVNKIRILHLDNLSCIMSSFAFHLLTFLKTEEFYPGTPISCWFFWYAGLAQSFFVSPHVSYFVPLCLLWHCCLFFAALFDIMLHLYLSDILSSLNDHLDPLLCVISIGYLYCIKPVHFKLISNSFLDQYSWSSWII